jgi:hypothetical protein
LTGEIAFRSKGDAKEEQWIVGTALLNVLGPPLLGLGDSDRRSSLGTLHRYGPD